MLTWSGTKPEDRVTVVGPVSQKWSFDGAHQPAPFYPQYILTGDPYYLNEMYMWAGFSAARYSVGNSPKGRGPTGAEGGIGDELRGAGWVLRNRAEAAFAAPDRAPEKTYFRYLTNDAIARWEGGSASAVRPSTGPRSSCGGRRLGMAIAVMRVRYLAIPRRFITGNRMAIHCVPNPIRRSCIMRKRGFGRPAWPDPLLRPGCSITSCMRLGRVSELGFAGKALLSYSGKWLTDMIRTSGNPYASAIYQLPVEKSGGGYFPSWAETLAVFTPEYLTNGLPPYFARNLNPDGRQVWGTPGLAYLVDNNDPGATEAWNWWKSNVYSKVRGFEGDPKWAIVPRSDKYHLPAQPTDIPPSH